MRVFCVWVRACCDLHKQNLQGIEMYYKMCCFYFDCLCTEDVDDIMYSLMELLDFAVLK